MSDSDKKFYNFLKILAGLTAAAALAIIANDYFGKNINKSWEKEVRKDDVRKIKAIPFPADFFIYKKSRRLNKEEIEAKKPELSYRYGKNITHKEQFLEYLQKTWGPCAPYSIKHFNEQIANNRFFAATYLKEADEEKPAGFLRIMWRYTNNGLLISEIFSSFNTLTKDNTWLPDENGDTLILVDCATFLKKVKGIAPVCIEHIYEEVIPRFERCLKIPNIITYSPDSKEAKKLHENVARSFDTELRISTQTFKDSRPEWPEDFQYKKPDSYVRSVKPIIYRGCRDISEKHYNPKEPIFWQIHSTP